MTTVPDRGGDDPTVDGGEIPSARGATLDDIAAFRDQFAGALHGARAEGRLLGLDLGTRTLGLALSDASRTIASALTTLARRKFSTDAAELLALAESHRVVGLVLGLPLNLDGSSGPRAQASRSFARNLNRLSALPILLWDERLSTVAAERVLLDADQSRRRRAEVIDKLAATVILQSALDRLRADRL